MLYSTNLSHISTHKRVQSHRIFQHQHQHLLNYVSFSSSTSFAWRSTFVYKYTHTHTHECAQNEYSVPTNDIKWHQIYTYQASAAASNIIISLILWYFSFVFKFTFSILYACIQITLEYWRFALLRGLIWNILDER